MTRATSLYTVSLSALIAFSIFLLFSFCFSRPDVWHESEQQPIELLGVPVYLAQKYLQRLINSINYPVKHLVIVVNGQEDEELNKYTESLEENWRRTTKFISKVTVIYNDNNEGVAAAWNQIVRVGIADHAKYYFIVGSDIAFHPISLSAIASYIHNPSVVNGYDFFNVPVCCTSNLSLLEGFFAFILTRNCYKTVGPFDENFFPAYYEDLDYEVRRHLSGLKRGVIPGIFLLHGEEDSQYRSGTMRLHEDIKYKYLIDRFKHLVASSENKEYFIGKWGESTIHNRSAPEYQRPFNAAGKFSEWTFDRERRKMILDRFHATWVHVERAMHQKEQREKAKAELKQRRQQHWKRQ